MGEGRRYLLFSRTFYLDDSNGAAVAHRALGAALARSGARVEALCGAAVDAGGGSDPGERLAAGPWPFEARGREEWSIGPGGVYVPDPPRLLARVDGVDVTFHRRPLRPTADPDPIEGAELVRLFDAACDRFRPEVLVTYGGDPLTGALLARAKARGAVTVFALHNFHYHDRAPFAHVDAVVVPSRYAADHYRRVLGLRCTALPNLIE